MDRCACCGDEKHVFNQVCPSCLANLLLDHEAMDLIRKGISGPSQIFHKGIFLGWSCGCGPIRNDPTIAVIAANRGEKDSIDAAIDSAISESGCANYREWLRSRRSYNET